MSLLNLSVDLCINITHYLTVRDLGQLRQTCKKLLFVCDHDVVWSSRVCRFLECDITRLRDYKFRDVYRAAYDFLSIREHCATALADYVEALHELDETVIDCVTQHQGDLEQLDLPELAEDNKLIIEFIDLLPPYPVRVEEVSYILPSIVICAYPDIQIGHWENGQWIDGRVVGLKLDITGTSRVLYNPEYTRFGVNSFLLFIRDLLSNSYCLSPQLSAGGELETHNWILTHRNLCIEC